MATNAGKKRNDVWVSLFQLSISIFSILFGWHEREQREPSTRPPFWTPHAALELIGRRFNQSPSTTLRSTSIDFCNWLNRFAPLESDAAVVGGECETVSSLNCSSSEAETVFRQYFRTNVGNNFQNWYLQVLYFWWNITSNLNLRRVLFADYRECEAGVAQSESLPILC